MTPTDRGMPPPPADGSLRMVLAADPRGEIGPLVWYAVVMYTSMAVGAVVLTLTDTPWWKGLGALASLATFAVIRFIERAVRKRTQRES